MTISQILKQKGSHVTSIEPTATIAELAHTLNEKRIGAVLVIDTAGQLLGIVSERDVVRCLSQHGAKVLQMTAAQLMTSDLQTATTRMTVDEALGMMTDGRFRHIPVVEEGKLIGLVSIGDVVKAKISAQAQDVDSLRAYVAGAA